MRFFVCIAAMLAASLFPDFAYAKRASLPEQSLFFTPEEVHQAETLARRAGPAGHGDIHLGAVMYYGPDDWVIWLQGEKWTPETARDDLSVLKVLESEVLILWRDDDNPEGIEIALRPNQSYQIATGKIIDQP